MTTGEQLDSISTVSNVSALNHLINPSGEGGGGIVINSEMIYIGEEGEVELEEINDIIEIGEDEDIDVVVVEDTIEIIEQEGDKVDGIC